MESIVDSKNKLHFFEYMEVDLMQDYFRQGIQYFLNAILQAHPALVPLRYYAPEISALIDFAKDYLSLKSYGGTYAENFFGFGRGNMGKWGALRGAFVWAILPYIGARLDNWYNQWVGAEMDGARLSLLKKFFTQIYPYLYAIWSLLQTFYRFRYLYLQDGKDYYYHLFYKFQKLHLSRNPQEQQQKYPLLELLKKPGLLSVLIGHKILTWYFSQKKEKRTQKQTEKKSIIPSPISQERVIDNGKCSICTKQLKNPTMVRQTGHVYCWECINGYVRREGRCPLGGVPVAAEQLQILYD